MERTRITTVVTIVQSLKENVICNDSIVVFGSDSGVKNGFGGNSLLCGEKRTVLDGDETDEYIPMK